MALRAPNSTAEARPAGVPAPASPGGWGRWWTPRAWVVVGLAVALLGLRVWSQKSYPADTEPAGAYLRIAQAVNRGRPEDVFPYTEEEAQHACYTVRDYRRRSLARAAEVFPPDRLAELQGAYGPFAEASDGRDVFALYATAQGWMDQLRRDLSGIDHVEISGKRATVVTARQTRYSFRLRPNGIWGLTAFTPTLTDEAERAARDWSLIEKAAEDYERAARRTPHSAVAPGVQKSSP